MEKLRAIFFKYRSYTPIPFLIAMLYFQEATITSLILGFIIAIIGEATRFWGVSYAGSETRTTGSVGGSQLVISGPFAHVRNPLYVGNMMMYVGIGIMSLALFPYLQIAALVFFLIQYKFIIDGEEEYLKKTFKQDYKQYCENVPRLIPQFRKYKNENLSQPKFDFSVGLKSEMRTLQAFFSVIVILLILFVVK